MKRRAIRVIAPVAENGAKLRGSRLCARIAIAGQRLGGRAGVERRREALPGVAWVFLQVLLDEQLDGGALVGGKLTARRQMPGDGERGIASPSQDRGLKLVLVDQAVPDGEQTQERVPPAVDCVGHGDQLPVGPWPWSRARASACAFQGVHDRLEFGPRLQSFDVRVFLDLVASLRAAVDGLAHEHDGAAEVIACQPTALGLRQLGVRLDLRDRLSEDARGIEARLATVGGGDDFRAVRVALAAASLNAPSLRSILASASKWPPKSVRTLSRFLLSRMA